MFGYFPIWDCSMKSAVHFILTIPNGRLFEREGSVITQRLSTVVLCFPQRSNHTHRLSPNVAAYIISEAARGSEHKPTHTCPLEQL